MEILGSCFCNAVQYKLACAPKALVNCHCNFCRKHSGAAFSTYAVFPEAALTISEGSDAIAVFNPAEHAHKHFCKQCGTPLFNKNARYPGLCMVYLGGISASLDMAPTANIYCESQLPWIKGIGEIRAFEQGIVRQA